MKQLRVRWVVLSMLVTMLLPILYSCGPRSARPSPQAPVRLAQTYDNIFFEGLSAGPHVEQVYVPEILKTEAMAIAVLQSKNAFRRVEKLVPGAAYEGPTLIVRACVTEMRLVSSGARLAFGILAGGSYMDVEVSVVDVATGNVVSKETINSANNPLAAVWVQGASDRGLATDMGGIVAGHIFETVPHRAP